MRIAGEPLFGARDADQFEEIDRLGFGFAPAGTFVQPNRFGYLLPGGVDRIQKGHRVLENHPDPVAADGTDLILRHLEQVVAVEVNRSAGVSSGRYGHETNDRPGRDTFAGT